MGAEGAVNIIFKDEIARSADPAAEHRRLVADTRRVQQPVRCGGPWLYRRRHRPVRHASAADRRPGDAGRQARQEPAEEARQHPAVKGGEAPGPPRPGVSLRKDVGARWRAARDWRGNRDAAVRPDPGRQPGRDRVAHHPRRPRARDRGGRRVLRRGRRRRPRAGCRRGGQDRPNGGPRRATCGPTRSLPRPSTPAPRRFIPGTASCRSGRSSPRRSRRRACLRRPAGRRDRGPRRQAGSPPDGAGRRHPARAGGRSSRHPSIEPNQLEALRAAARGESASRCSSRRRPAAAVGACGASSRQTSCRWR